MAFVREFVEADAVAAFKWTSLKISCRTYFVSHEGRKRQGMVDENRKKIEQICNRNMKIANSNLSIFIF